MKLNFRDNRGAALVELALTTPLFLIMILGATELGRMAYYGIEVENAARAGASYGAVNMGNAFDYATVQQAAKNDAPDLPGLVATASTACVCETVDTSTGTPSYNPSTGTVSCSSSAVSDGACTGASNTTTLNTIEYVTVSTQAQVKSLFQLPGLPSVFTLYGYSQMRTLPN